MTEDIDFTSDLEFEFLPSSEFELQSIDDANVVGRNALRALMMGWHDASPLLSQRTLRAIFYERDPDLLRGMRLAFQEGFLHLYQTQLKDHSFSDNQLEQAHLYLSNCLSLLPFSDITPYESFQIPEYVDGQWQLVQYKVVPIELTPQSGFEALFLRDEDRVFAYGLEPIDHPRARSHLIFMGTTYPAGQGFLSQIDTDLEAFETAGKKLYRTGVERISAWLDKQNHKPHVCGMSLGGALALLLAMHQGNKLSRVDALNPAGIYDPWFKSKFDCWDADNPENPLVTIQRQGDDQVSRFGIYKRGFRLLDIIPPKDKQGPNFLADHALNYAGLKGTMFKQVVDVAQDNAARWLRNVIFYNMLRVIVHYMIMVPYRYVLRPPLRYAFSHPREVSVGLLALAGLVLFPELLLPLSASFLLNLALSALIITGLTNSGITWIQDMAKGESHSSLMKAWLDYQRCTLLTKTLLAVAAIVLVGVAAWLPMSWVAAVYVGISVPSMINAGYQLSRLYGIIAGVAQNETACLHDPSLARNADMDIYAVQVTQDVSEDMLNSYHQARQLIGAPEHIQSDCTERKERGRVQVTGSIAAIYEFKQTVASMQFFAKHPDKSACIQQLNHIQQEYNIGCVK